MKHKSTLIILMLLLSVLSVNAQSDCSLRGNVVFTLDKGYYKAGETITGKIKVTNNNLIDSPLLYNFRFLKGDYSPWALKEIRNVPPGNSSFEFYQIFRVAVPYGSETGKWVAELVGTMDNCVYYNPEIFELVSCSDGKLNGDETGLDCGGTCENKCAVAATTIQATTTIQPTGGSSYIEQLIPYQPSKKLIIYLGLIIILLMIITGSSIIYWRKRARFSKFY